MQPAQPLGRLFCHPTCRPGFQTACCAHGAACQLSQPLLQEGHQQDTGELCGFCSAAGGKLRTADSILAAMPGHAETWVDSSLAQFDKQPAPAALHRPLLACQPCRNFEMQTRNSWTQTPTRRARLMHSRTASGWCHQEVWQASVWHQISAALTLMSSDGGSIMELQLAQLYSLIQLDSPLYSEMNVSPLLCRPGC